MFKQAKNTLLIFIKDKDIMPIVNKMLDRLLVNSPRQKSEGTGVNPERYLSRSCLVSGPSIFSPLKGINCYITYYLLSYVFLLNTQKVTKKVSPNPPCEPSGLNILRGTKTAF